MGERILKDSEIEKLTEYISECAKNIKRIKEKGINWRLVSPDFLTPSISTINVPLSSEAGEYLYYQKYINSFSEVLKKGIISEKEVGWYQLGWLH